MSSGKDQRTGWLARLKVGDPVALWTPAGRDGDTSLKEAPVERITPTGRLVVDGVMYGPDGYAPDKWGRKYLGPSSKHLTNADLQKWNIKDIRPHWRENGAVDLEVVPYRGYAVMFRNCKIARGKFDQVDHKPGCGVERRGCVPGCENFDPKFDGEA
jgi:hypothetical protein